MVADELKSATNILLSKYITYSMATKVQYGYYFLYKLPSCYFVVQTVLLNTVIVL